MPSSEREAIQLDPERSLYVCSPMGAARMLDVPVASVWRNYIETGDLRVIYEPEGFVSIEVPLNRVVNRSTMGS